ncbi:hypothetical protein ACH41C_26705 [Streptomyces althioticus]|uniref:hypothetical protein n=1 Tax=Streptomyces althioticus TaxID=83380 RepID=UPI0033E6A1FA
MSGRPDSDLPPDTQTAEDLPESFAGTETETGTETGTGTEPGAGTGTGTGPGAGAGTEAELPDDDLLDEQARRARWAAVGTGVVLALAGTAAAVLRASGAAPALVPVAYACGAAVCALAAVLGARGRTRRALWAAVAGVMIMALGDQFD